MKLFYRILRIRRAVAFRKEEGNYGSCYPVNREEPILINLRLHGHRDPVKTFVHEAIHVLYPDMSERNVRAVENYLWERITARQQFLLAKKLYSRPWRSR